MNRISLLLLLPLAACSAARPSAAPAPAAETAAVVAVAERLFAAMETRDTAAIRALFLPQARIIAIERVAGEARVRDRGVAEFLPSVATSPETLVERMWSPEVRIDGDLAALWAPYDFHRGSRFSHCGSDAFHLVRSGGAWRIATLSYTIQREGCAPSPPPGALRRV
jgi:hypothetical protein